MADCCVCDRKNLLDSELKTIVLSDLERQFAVANSGKEAPLKYTYCKPCLRLLQNPVTGAQMLRGSLEANLRDQGIPEPEKLADKYFKALIKRTPAKPPS